ncbi:receptor-like protein 2 [Lolium perenne]|uniref:receptor-like protein 2 n=1 Tax=Lolium perenne TaxID=4522 RepID=UPI0021EB1CAE|nr:tyrosine-sulfated glycopeptide receptor 1-like [Lolium perenne]
MQPLSHIHRNIFPTPLFGLALVLLVSLASPTSSCTEQQKSSLLQLLAGLSREGGLTASWRSDMDCCSWEGITCSPNGTVTDVSLASRGLEGPISPFLGNLTGLLRLNLSGNLLSGGLPLELVSSSSIIVLDVSFNRLTGGLHELPPSTPVRPLQILNISSNLFTGRFPTMTWEVMKSLVVLNASTNSFTGQIPTTPCVSAPSFAVLEVSFNQFSGNIPQGLINCTVMKLLSAGYNNLSGTLPKELFNVTSLEHLSLPNNRLEGPLNGIMKLTNLVILDLGGNELSGKIPDSIGELTRLEELHLDHNNMSGELPSGLSNCINLTTIDLKSNYLSGKLTNVNFSNLSNLKKIDLLYNHFTGDIPESIYSCSKLTALRLSYNHFHGQLSEKIGNLKSLSFLSLVNNSLTNITRTLQILSDSRSLTTLFIGFNFLHETMPEGDSIDGFVNLQVLSINDCSLSGKIPDWLSKIPNLGMLLLHNNELAGPIPAWISSLNFLFYLDISNNSLTGEIPSALMEMPMLESEAAAPMVFELPVYNKSPFIQYLMPGAFPKVLNLGINNLTGLIPEKIDQLKALISLNLSSNKLSGEIPRLISTLTNLQVLDLSSNHLTGTIPSALNNLHFLSKFNICNNDLEGAIPTVGQLSTFPSSSFDGNPKLCGPVVGNHCGLAEASPVSIDSAKQFGNLVIFFIAFGVFFGIGVLYDQIVLARYFC